MSEPALKPCPFCGGRVTFDWILFTPSLVWRSAYCRTIFQSDKGEGSTAEDWNRRADTDATS